MATLKDSQDTLERNFLNACKTGEVEVVKECILQGVNINCFSGWPLRRAVRYNKDRVWRYLLSFEFDGIYRPSKPVRTFVTFILLTFVQDVEDPV